MFYLIIFAVAFIAVFGLRSAGIVTLICFGVFALICLAILISVSMSRSTPIEQYKAPTAVKDDYSKFGTVDEFSKYEVKPKAKAVKIKPIDPVIKERADSEIAGNEYEFYNYCGGPAHINKSPTQYDICVSKAKEDYRKHLYAKYAKIQK